MPLIFAPSLSKGERQRQSPNSVPTFQDRQGRTVFRHWKAPGLARLGLALRRRLGKVKPSPPIRRHGRFARALSFVGGWRRCRPPQPGRFLALSLFTFRLDERRVDQLQRPCLVLLDEFPKIADRIVHGGLPHGTLEFVGKRLDNGFG